MAQAMAAEQALELISQMGVPPQAVIQIIDMVYAMNQDEVVRLKEALMQAGGGEGGQEEQLVQAIAAELQNGTPPEQVAQMLVEQGATPEEAQQLVTMVMEQVGGGQGGAPAEQYADEQLRY